MVSSSSNGPASFVSNASIALRSTPLEWRAALSAKRAVCTVFPTRRDSGACENFATSRWAREPGDSRKIKTAHSPT